MFNAVRPARNCGDVAESESGSTGSPMDQQHSSVWRRCVAWFVAVGGGAVCGGDGRVGFGVGGRSRVTAVDVAAHLCFGFSCFLRGPFPLQFGLAVLLGLLAH